MSDRDYLEWDEDYIKPIESLPWEIGRHREQLVELLKRRIVKKGKALAICCGAGTPSERVFSDDMFQP